MKIKVDVLKRRNHFVPLVIRKTGAGKHKDKKREAKNTHQE